MVPLRSGRGHSNASSVKPMSNVKIWRMGALTIMVMKSEALFGALCGR